MSGAGAPVAPQLPYYAAIFTSLRSDEDDAAYAAASARMIKLASTMPGFLGVESAREEIGITVSYWRDLESIANWKRHGEHLAAQGEGRLHWYDWYRLRIARVEREYEHCRITSDD